MSNPNPGAANPGGGQPTDQQTLQAAQIQQAQHLQQQAALAAVANQQSSQQQLIFNMQAQQQAQQQVQQQAQASLAQQNLAMQQAAQIQILQGGRHKKIRKCRKNLKLTNLKFFFWKTHLFERSVQQANNQVNNQSNGQLNGQMNNLPNNQQNDPVTNNPVTNNPAATILSSNPNSGSVATAGVNNLINKTTESSFQFFSHSKHVIFKIFQKLINFFAPFNQILQVLKLPKLYVTPQII